MGLIHMRKGFAERAWTHSLEWEINVLSMVPGLSVGQASLGISLGLMGSEYHKSSVCMEVWGSEKRVLNMYVCVHPCCQCIVPCSPTRVLCCYSEGDPLEVTKVAAEPYFLLISDFPRALAFLCISIAICKISHNSTFFSIGVNLEVRFLFRLFRRALNFFLSILLKDQLFLSYLARWFPFHKLLH